MSSSIRLVLASGSPRRRQLLAEAGLSFEYVESGVEELRELDEIPGAYALRMAGAKACAVSRKIPDALVLGADTIVECAGEVLEKPRDSADAYRMLARL